MNRIRRLYNLWGWLPAFRVVAEAEHLPTASEQLGITPQALSRSIKLLEEHLDCELFSRAGRRLVLTEVGREFLEHVRASMRNLDDGVSIVTGVGFGEAAHVAASAHHAWLLVKPALSTLALEAPSLIPSIHNATGVKALDGVRKGTFDVAIGEFHRADRTLVIEPLTRLRSAVFCGTSHPLYERRHVTIEELQAFPFVAPLGDESDGWPVSVERQVGVQVDSFQFALELCAAGSYLAMFPDSIRADNNFRNRLSRIPVDISSSREIHLAYRKPTGHHQLTETLLTALHQSAERIATGQRDEDG